MKSIAVLALIALLLAGCQPAAPCRCAAPPLATIAVPPGRQLGELLPFWVDVEYQFVGGVLHGQIFVERVPLDRPVTFEHLPRLRDRIFGYTRTWTDSSTAGDRLRVQMKELTPDPRVPTGSTPTGMPPPGEAPRGSSGASSPRDSASPPARADPPGK